MRQRQAARVLPFAAQAEAEIGAEFDRLMAVVLAEINDLLIARGARRDARAARLDAVSLAELFRLITSRLRPEAILRRLFGQIERESAQALRRQLPGLPIPEVISNGARLQEAWVSRNVDLIKVEDPIKKTIERVLAQPLDRGVRVEEVREQLREEFGFSKRRAQLIARDQTLKLSGQLQEARQTQVGITRYVWTTSDDERVRPRHEDLNGTVQLWAEPPIVDLRTGRREHPGGDFQCRCTADPILDDPELAEELNPGQALEE